MPRLMAASSAASSESGLRSTLAMAAPFDDAPVRAPLALPAA